MAKSISKEAVYQLLSQIPAGCVSTYGEIARKLETKAFRGVGQIIGANPNAPKVPCHRVVKSGGELGGYAFGIDKKIALLKKEGVIIENGKVKNFKEKLFKF